MARLANMQAGYKKNPQELNESDSDSIPMRRKSRKAKTTKATIEESDDEFELSAGDLASDLDFEEEIPQKSAMPPKAKTTSRLSGIGGKKPKVSAITPAAGPPRKSAPMPKTRDNGSKVDKEDQVIGGGFSSVQEIHDALPDFLKPHNLKDKFGKRPDHPDYDSTTLDVPQHLFKNFTPAMCQYWLLKVDNFEKIFFFKLGKFYELFFADAIICQKLLDLNWMGGAKKLHIGFPEKALDKYLTVLVNHGFKVAVIEQTETPRMLEERKVRERQAGKKHFTQNEKCCARAICNMVTKGTYKAGE